MLKRKSENFDLCVFLGRLRLVGPVMQTRAPAHRAGSLTPLNQAIHIKHDRGYVYVDSLLFTYRNHIMTIREMGF